MTTFPFEQLRKRMISHTRTDQKKLFREVHHSTEQVVFTLQKMRESSLFNNQDLMHQMEQLLMTTKSISALFYDLSIQKNKPASAQPSHETSKTFGSDSASTPTQVWKSPSSTTKQPKPQKGKSKSTNKKKPRN